MKKAAKKKTSKPASGGNRPEKTTRRSFLSILWAGLGLCALVELLGVGFLFLRRGKAEKPFPESRARVDCGAADRYRPSSVTAFVQGRFYLVRLAEGGFLAVSRRCTHLGCTVPWIEEENRFACPCHASAFDIRGEVIYAPAPRPLDLYPVSIENDRIAVDTREAVRRSGFHPEQVVYPKST